MGILQIIPILVVWVQSVFTSLQENQKKIPRDAYIWNHVMCRTRNLLFMFYKQSFFYYDVNMSDNIVFCLSTTFILWVMQG